MPYIEGPKFRWFAWRPVYTEDRGYRWLCMVWRQGILRYSDYDPPTRRFFNAIDKDFL